jgi:hypothetical protein
MENAGLGHGNMLVPMLSGANVTPCTRMHVLWPARTQLQVHPYVKFHFPGAYSLFNPRRGQAQFS